MRFGTLLFDNEAERTKASANLTMPSLWNFMDSCHERSPEFVNFHFRPGEKSLRANTSVVALKLWDLYTRGPRRDYLAYETVTPLADGFGRNSALLRMMHEIRTFENQRSEGVCVLGGKGGLLWKWKLSKASLSAVGQLPANVAFELADIAFQPANVAFKCCV